MHASTYDYQRDMGQCRRHAASRRSAEGMTRDDAEEAIKALGRAIDALGKTPPDVVRALNEITEAQLVVSSTAVASPHANKALRPSLNFHIDE